MRIDFTELRKLALAGETTKLVEKLFDIEDEMIKEKLQDKERWYDTHRIITNENFLNTKTLIGVGSYYVSSMTDLVLDFGYDKVNAALLNLAEEYKATNKMEENNNE